MSRLEAYAAGRSLSFTSGQTPFHDGAQVDADKLEKNGLTVAAAAGKVLFQIMQSLSMCFKKIKIKIMQSLSTPTAVPSLPLPSVGVQNLQHRRWALGTQENRRFGPLCLLTIVRMVPFLGCPFCW